jgi:hypothetical protein
MNKILPWSYINPYDTWQIYPPIRTLNPHNFHHRRGNVFQLYLLVQPEDYQHQCEYLVIDGMANDMLTYTRQYPWPAEITGIERIALSAKGDLQRVLRYVDVPLRAVSSFIGWNHSVPFSIAQFPLPLSIQTLITTSLLTHPPSPCPSLPPLLQSQLLPLIFPSSRRDKCTCNARAELSAPQLRRSASHRQDVRT